MKFCTAKINYTHIPYWHQQGNRPREGKDCPQTPAARGALYPGGSASDWCSPVPSPTPPPTPSQHTLVALTQQSLEKQHQLGEGGPDPNFFLHFCMIS